MFAVVMHGSRPRSVYTHEDTAAENCPPDFEVVELSSEDDPERIIWDSEAGVWIPAEPMLSHVEMLRQCEEHRVRRAQAYAEQLDRGIVQEVLLDVVLELAANPAFVQRLRASTQEKLQLLQSTIEGVKAAHPRQSNINI